MMAGVSSSNDQDHPEQSPDSGEASAPIPADLEPLRRRIDEIDRRLIELLNERAQIVVDVGRHKRAKGVPIYSPHRESAVLKKVLDASTGPLPKRTVEAIFRELMSGSFALERPLRIGYLGPAGSFSHQAATAHFGSSVEFQDVHTIEGVFTEVRRGHVDYGLAPIENSTGGGIVETLDAFREARAELTIYAEALLNVHHNLFAGCPPESIKRIHSKPEVFEQCRRWLGTQFPEAELVPAASTSQAVITARQCAERDANCGDAAIAGALAGKIHGLDALFEKIEDNPNNITRFFILSRERAQPSGDDKTSIMFQTADKPGALVEVLTVFQNAGINLSHIDKRPSGRVNWTYTFFIDAQGHRDDPRMRGAFEEASKHCVELSVLGSYPRATRIL